MITHTAIETEEEGRRLGETLRKGDVVSLRGSLGAGKTVLAKGIAKALGITEAIVSPTFTLVQEYDGKEKLYHLDLYRLSGEDEFESMGGEEFLYPSAHTLGSGFHSLYPAAGNPGEIYIVVYAVSFRKAGHEFPEDLREVFRYRREVGVRVEGVHGDTYPRNSVESSFSHRSQCTGITGSGSRV